MTSDRPYRSAMSREQAEAVLREVSGSQLDPRVVEAFLRILPDLDPGRASGDADLSLLLDPRGPEAMLLLLFLLAGACRRPCLGGSLRRAAAFPLRGPWLPLAAYALKALGGAIGVPPLPLCLAQYGLLLLFAGSTAASRAGAPPRWARR